MTLHGSIFPLDDQGNPIEAEREIQQGFYYLEEIIVDPDAEIDPDAEPVELRISWTEPEYPHVIVDVTLEQAQAGLPFRAQWRQDRDALGRNWSWDLI